MKITDFNGFFFNAQTVTEYLGKILITFILLQYQTITLSITITKRPCKTIKPKKKRTRSIISQNNFRLLKMRHVCDGERDKLKQNNEFDKKKKKTETKVCPSVRQILYYIKYFSRL